MKLNLLLAFLLLGTGVIAAQSLSVTTNLSNTPTTKVLAIGRLTASATPDKFPPVMGDEVRSTVKLYLNGKIDQWYARKDQNGVVFVMNVTTIEEARQLLESLPLGKAKLMDFDLIPIGPLSPLRVLLNEAVSSGQAKP